MQEENLQQTSNSEPESLPTLDGVTTGRLILNSVTSEEEIFQVLRPGGEKPLRPGERHQLTPLCNIARMLVKLGCVTVVVQEPVLEKEYHAEFKAFYATTFHHHPRYSRRLHFFSVEALETETVLDFVDRVSGPSVAEPDPNQTEGYLGFVNVRPIKSSPIGRSVLVPPPECRFLTVGESFRSTLAGNSLRVHGAPFMQQDGAVAACAQVAIWTALRSRRKTDGRDAVTIADVSAAADGGVLFGPMLPTQGLSSNAMFSVLERLGYHGHNIPTQRYLKTSDASSINVMFMQAMSDADRIKELIYPYIESGIPVILLFKEGGEDYAHAAVAVGHDWCKPAILEHGLSRKIVLDEKSKEGFAVLSPVNWVGSIYIQNDNEGPYRKLSKDTSPYNLGSVTNVIPVVPKDIYVLAEDAYPVLRTVLEILFRAAQRASQGSQASTLDRQFVIRPLLTSRHEFRRWAAENTEGELQRFYRQRHLPERIWVFEINHVFGYTESASGMSGYPDLSRMQRLGEVLIDPTGEKNDLSLLLCAHINFSMNGKMGPNVVLDFEMTQNTFKAHLLASTTSLSRLQERESATR